MAEEAVIVEQLMMDIHAGKYEPHEKLPSEHTLADRFKVPRITVRKAYERLQQQGYIYSMQGKGSFVKNRNLQIPLLLSGNVSFSEKMSELGYDFQSKNVGCEEIAYNKKIYHALGVDEHDRIFKIGRLRFIDEKPIALHISYVAKSVFADIDERGKEISSMFAYYSQNGYTDFCSSTSYLRVIYPTNLERQMLQCASLIPLLELESGCMDKKSGKVLEHTQILYRSDCFTYVL